MKLSTACVLTFVICLAITTLSVSAYGQTVTYPSSVLCSVPTAPAGFKVSTGVGSITLAAPATPVAAYTFSVSCAQVAAPTQPVITTSCSQTQVSTAFPNGAVLSRQCSGNIYRGPYRPKANGVAWQSIDPIFEGNWTTGYQDNNAPFTPSINAGQYMSLAFTPLSATTIVFNYMGSYGTNGFLSFSKTPGDFKPADPNCVASGSNNLLGYTAPSKYPPYCSIPADGSTYYVNFAPVDANGSPVSWKSTTNPVPLNYYLTKG